MTHARAVFLFRLLIAGLFLPALVSAQQLQCAAGESKTNCTTPNGGITTVCGTKCPAWEETVTPGSGTVPTPTTNKKVTEDKDSCDTVILNTSSGSKKCWKEGVQGNRSGVSCKVGGVTCASLMEDAKKALEAGGTNISNGGSAQNTDTSTAGLQQYNEDLQRVFGTPPSNSEILPQQPDEIGFSNAQVEALAARLDQLAAEGAQTGRSIEIENTEATRSFGDALGFRVGDVTRLTPTLQGGFDQVRQFFSLPDGGTMSLDTAGNAEISFPNTPTGIRGATGFMEARNEIGATTPGGLSPLTQGVQSAAQAISDAATRLTTETLPNIFQAASETIGTAWEGLKELVTPGPTEYTLAPTEFPEAPFENLPAPSSEGIISSLDPDVSSGGDVLDGLLPSSEDVIKQFEGVAPEKFQRAVADYVLDKQAKGELISSNEALALRAAVEEQPDSRAWLTKLGDSLGLRISDRAQALAAVDGVVAERVRQESLANLAENAAGPGLDAQRMGLTKASAGQTSTTQTPEALRQKSEELWEEAKAVEATDPKAAEELRQESAERLREAIAQEELTSYPEREKNVALNEEHGELQKEYGEKKDTFTKQFEPTLVNGKCTTTACNNAALAVEKASQDLNKFERTQGSIRDASTADATNALVRTRGEGVVKTIEGTKPAFETEFENNAPAARPLSEEIAARIPDANTTAAQATLNIKAQQASAELSRKDFQAWLDKNNVQYNATLGKYVPGKGTNENTFNTELVDQGNRFLETKSQTDMIVRANEATIEAIQSREAAQQVASWLRTEPNKNSSQMLLENVFDRMGIDKRAIAYQNAQLDAFAENATAPARLRQAVVQGLEQESQAQLDAAKALDAETAQKNPYNSFTRWMDFLDPSETLYVDDKNFDGTSMQVPYEEWISNREKLAQDYRDSAASLQRQADFLKTNGTLQDKLAPRAIDSDTWPLIAKKIDELESLPKPSARELSNPLLADSRVKAVTADLERIAAGDLTQDERHLLSVQRDPLSMTAAERVTENVSRYFQERTALLSNIKDPTGITQVVINPLAQTLVKPVVLANEIINPTISERWTRMGETSQATAIRLGGQVALATAESVLFLTPPGLALTTNALKYAGRGIGVVSDTVLGTRFTQVGDSVASGAARSSATAPALRDLGSTPEFTSFAQTATPEAAAVVSRGGARATALSPERTANIARYEADSIQAAARAEVAGESRAQDLFRSQAADARANLATERASAVRDAAPSGLPTSKAQEWNAAIQGHESAANQFRQLAEDLRARGTGDGGAQLDEAINTSLAKAFGAEQGAIAAERPLVALVKSNPVAVTRALEELAEASPRAPPTDAAGAVAADTNAGVRASESEGVIAAERSTSDAIGAIRPNPAERLVAAEAPKTLGTRIREFFGLNRSTPTPTASQSLSKFNTADEAYNARSFGDVLEEVRTTGGESLVQKITSGERLTLAEERSLNTLLNEKGFTVEGLQEAAARYGSVDTARVREIASIVERTSVDLTRRGFDVQAFTQLSKEEAITRVQKIFDTLADDIARGTYTDAEAAVISRQFSERVMRFANGNEYRAGQVLGMGEVARGNNVGIGTGGGKTLTLAGEAGVQRLRFGNRARTEISTPDAIESGKYLTESVGNGRFTMQEVFRMNGLEPIDISAQYLRGAEGIQAMKVAPENAIFISDRSSRNFLKLQNDAELNRVLDSRNLVRVDEVQEFASSRTSAVLAKDTRALSAQDAITARAESFADTVGLRRLEAVNETASVPRLNNLERTEIKTNDWNTAIGDFNRDARPAYAVEQGGDRIVLNNKAIEALENKGFDLTPGSTDSNMIQQMLRRFEEKPGAANAYGFAEVDGARRIVPYNAQGKGELSQVSQDTAGQIAIALKHGYNPTEVVRVSRSSAEASLSELFGPNLRNGGQVVGLSGTPQGTRALTEARIGNETVNISTSRLNIDRFGTLYTDAETMLANIPRSLDSANVLVFARDPEVLRAAEARALSGEFGSGRIVSYGPDGLKINGRASSENFNDLLNVGNKNGDIFLINEQGAVGRNYQGNFHLYAMDVPPSDLLTQLAGRVERPISGGTGSWQGERFLLVDEGVMADKVRAAADSTARSEYARAMRQLDADGTGPALFDRAIAELEGSTAGRLSLAERAELHSKLGQIDELDRSAKFAAQQAIRAEVELNPLKAALVDSRLTASEKVAVQRAYEDAINAPAGGGNLLAQRTPQGGFARDSYIQNALDSSIARSEAALSGVEAELGGGRTMSPALRNRVDEWRAQLKNGKDIDVRNVSPINKPFAQAADLGETVGIAKRLGEHIVTPEGPSRFANAQVAAAAPRNATGLAGLVQDATRNSVSVFNRLVRSLEDVSGRIANALIESEKSLTTTSDITGSFGDSTTALDTNTTLGKVVAARTNAATRLSNADTLDLSTKYKLDLQRQVANYDRVIADLTSSPEESPASSAQTVRSTGTDDTAGVYFDAPAQAIVERTAPNLSLVTTLEGDTYSASDDVLADLLGSISLTHVLQDLILANDNNRSDADVLRGDSGTDVLAPIPTNSATAQILPFRTRIVRAANNAMQSARNTVRTGALSLSLLLNPVAYINIPGFGTIDLPTASSPAQAGKYYGGRTSITQLGEAAPQQMVQWVDQAIDEMGLQGKISRNEVLAIFSQETVNLTPDTRSGANAYNIGQNTPIAIRDVYEKVTPANIKDVLEREFGTAQQHIDLVTQPWSKTYEGKLLSNEQVLESVRGSVYATVAELGALRDRYGLTSPDTRAGAYNGGRQNLFRSLQDQGGYENWIGNRNIPRETQNYIRQVDKYRTALESGSVLKKTSAWRAVQAEITTPTTLASTNALLRAVGFGDVNASVRDFLTPMSFSDLDNIVMARFDAGIGEASPPNSQITLANPVGDLPKGSILTPGSEGKLNAVTPEGSSYELVPAGESSRPVTFAEAKAELDKAIPDNKLVCLGGEYCTQNIPFDTLDKLGISVKLAPDFQALRKPGGDRNILPGGIPGKAFKIFALQCQQLGAACEIVAGTDRGRFEVRNQKTGKMETFGHARHAHGADEGIKMVNPEDGKTYQIGTSIDYRVRPRNDYFSNPTAKKDKDKGYKVTTYKGDIAASHKTLEEIAELYGVEETGKGTYAGKTGMHFDLAGEKWGPIKKVQTFLSKVFQLDTSAPASEIARKAGFSGPKEVRTTVWQPIDANGVPSGKIVELTSNQIPVTPQKPLPAIVQAGLEVQSPIDIPSQGILNRVNPDIALNDDVTPPILVGSVPEGAGTQGSGLASAPTLPANVGTPENPTLLNAGAADAITPVQHKELVVYIARGPSESTINAWQKANVGAVHIDPAQMSRGALESLTGKVDEVIFYFNGGALQPGESLGAAGRGAKTYQLRGFPGERVIAIDKTGREYQLQRMRQNLETLKKDGKLEYGDAITFDNFFACITQSNCLQGSGFIRAQDAAESAIAHFEDIAKLADEYGLKIELKNPHMVQEIFSPEQFARMFDATDIVIAESPLSFKLTSGAPEAKLYASLPVNKELYVIEFAGNPVEHATTLKSLGVKGASVTVADRDYKIAEQARVAFNAPAPQQNPVPVQIAGAPPSDVANQLVSDSPTTVTAEKPRESLRTLAEKGILEVFEKSYTVGKEIAKGIQKASNTVRETARGLNGRVQVTFGYTLRSSTAKSPDSKTAGNTPASHSPEIVVGPAKEALPGRASNVSGESPNSVRVITSWTELPAGLRNMMKLGGRNAEPSVSQATVLDLTKAKSDITATVEASLPKLELLPLEKGTGIAASEKMQTAIALAEKADKAAKTDNAGEKSAEAQKAAEAQAARAKAEVRAAEARITSAQAQVDASLKKLAERQQGMKQAESVAKEDKLKALEMTKGLAPRIKSEVDALAAAAEDLGRNPLVSIKIRTALIDQATIARDTAGALSTGVQKFSQQSYVNMYLGGDKFKIRLEAQGVKIKQAVAQIKTLSGNASMPQGVVPSPVALPVVKVLAPEDSLDAIIPALDDLKVLVDLNLNNARIIKGPFDIVVARDITPVDVDFAVQKPPTTQVSITVPSGETSPTRTLRGAPVAPEKSPIPDPISDPLLLFGFLRRRDAQTPASNPQPTPAPPSTPIENTPPPLPTLTIDGGPLVPVTANPTVLARVQKRISDWWTGNLASRSSVPTSSGGTNDALIQRLDAWTSAEASREFQVQELARVRQLAQDIRNKEVAYNNEIMRQTIEKASDAPIIAQLDTAITKSDEVIEKLDTAGVLLAKGNEAGAKSAVIEATSDARAAAAASRAAQEGEIRSLLAVANERVVTAAPASKSLYDSAAKNLDSAESALRKNTAAGDIEAKTAVARAADDFRAAVLAERTVPSALPVALAPTDAGNIIGRLDAFQKNSTGGTVPPGGGSGGGAGSGSGSGASSSGDGWFKRSGKGIIAWCASGRYKFALCGTVGITPFLATYGIVQNPAIDTANDPSQTRTQTPTDLTKSTDVITSTTPDATKESGTKAAPAEEEVASAEKETKEKEAGAADKSADTSGGKRDENTGERDLEDTGAGANTGLGGGRSSIFGSGSGGFLQAGTSLLGSLFQSLMGFFGGGSEEEDNAPQTPSAPPQIPEAPVGTIVANPSLIDAGTTTRLSWSSVGTDAGSTTCAVITADFSVYARGGQNGTISSPTLTESTRFGVVCNVSQGKEKLLNETLVRVRGDETDPPRIFGAEQVSAIVNSATSGSNATAGTGATSGTGASSGGGQSGNATPEDVRTCEPQQPIDSFIRCLCEAEPNPAGCSVPAGGLR